MGGNSFRVKTDFTSQRKKIQNALKNNKKIKITAIAFVAMGCFFYAWNQHPLFYVHTYAQQESVASVVDLKEELQNREPFLADVEVLEKKDFAKQEIEEKLYTMVGETPIREMVPFIAQQEQTVAALIVGIAKKESSWGEHVPTLNGQDCFNYWGYKGNGSRGSSMGYGCFASPEEGVNVIGARIGSLVEKNMTTPSKMVVWKCGSSCAAHDPVAVRKWITDVDAYFNKIIAFAS